MIKHIYTFCCFLLLVNLSQAAVFNKTINKTVDSVTTSYQLDFTGDSVYDVTFNYFANGSITITGRIGNGNNNYFATGSISGLNNYPVKVANNKTFTDLTTWKSNSIFVQSPVLNYADFVGKGNQYIVGRMVYSGAPEFYYFWVLLNVNSNGTKLNLLKCAFETEPNVALLTGNEGASGSGTNLNNAFTNHDFSVFPQPANDQIEVQTNEVVEMYRIFDLNGQKLTEEYYYKNKIISVANLPKGIYLLQLLNNNQFTTTKKIIIE